VRQLRRDHRSQRQLLPLPQLRQQHGLFVTDGMFRCTSPTVENHVGVGIRSLRPQDSDVRIQCGMGWWGGL
jgi:hypothetical protein